MSPNGKFNLLLIHDDGATHRYRIGRGLLRAVIAMAFVLPVLGFGGLWLGWEAWQHAHMWEQEERVLQQELAELRVQFERLSNVEALLQRHKSENAKPGQGGKDAQNAPAQQPTPGAPADTGNQPEAGQGKPTAPTALDGQPAGAQDQLIEPAMGNSESTGDGAAPQPGQPAQSGQSGQATAAVVVVDTGKARVDNVVAQLVDGRRLRIRIDLYNESPSQLSGKLELFVLTADGQRYPLMHNDPSFRISRLKKFVTTSPVPSSARDMTNASLLVEVTSTDKTLLFRQLYPVAD